MNKGVILALPVALLLTACLTTTAEQKKPADLDKLSCKELRDLRQDMAETKERADGGINILGSLASLAPASGGLIDILGKSQDLGGLTLYQVENAMKLSGCKG